MASVAFEHAIDLYGTEQRTVPWAQRDPQYDEEARKARATTTAAIAGFAKLHGVDTYDAAEMVAATCQARNDLGKAALRAIQCNTTIREAMDMAEVQRLAQAFDVSPVVIARALVSAHYHSCMTGHVFAVRLSDLGDLAKLFGDATSDTDDEPSEGPDATSEEDGNQETAE